MAKIRGWKKLGVNSWINEATSIIVEVKKQNLYYKTPWFVFIHDRQKSVEDFKYRVFFKTKKLGVNNAIKWMRKHPKG